ncbi:MAG: hypothetical protein JNK02_00715 [Planctomycetes bacterium]|nr:hypothetical protein [Planctomycetota bacterium]
MTNAPRAPRPALPPTPALDRLVERVRARLAALVLLHGLGTTAAAAAAWLAFAFLADWFLHLPAPVRVFHLLVLAGLPLFVAARSVLRPWRLRPGRAGAAVLVERAHPGQGELLVSAVELGASPAPSGDPRLIERVLRDADRAAAGLDARGVLDARGPWQRALLGLVAVGLSATLLALNPEAASVFLARIAGGATPWPQRTHLALEIPSATGGTEAAGAEGELVVRVARGADVPVVVRASGEVPEEVVLHFEGGHRSVLGSSGGAVFRTLLRSVQEDLVFHATGGDDQDGEPRVRLVVLEPPDVVGIAVAIEPPAYSGLPRRLESSPDVEVLRGSRVVVHARTAPAEVTARARFLPEDQLVELEPAAFPGSDGASGFAFELTAERNLRYRFELQDAQGLSNPDPGLYGITVVEDRAPEVELLSPGRGDHDTVAGGLLPLRVRASDDFRVARLEYAIAPPNAEPEPDAWRELATRPLTPEERGAAEPERGSPVRSIVFARARIAVRDLAAAPAEGGAAPALEGSQFQLVVRATDAAEPAPREGRAAPIRIRVVQPEEFLRRIQDRLARAQGQTSALLELQREKRRLVLEMLAALTSDAPGIEDAQGDLAQALTGGRRVQGDARALARELAGAAESVLYARLDERAGAALEQLDASYADSVARGFDPGPWREFAAGSAARELAGAGLAAKLVDIAALALEIGEDHALAAVADLARAQDAADLERVRTHLRAAAAAQARALERLERLLERLAEWDNFQSVLGLTRDILSGQKSLRERTRESVKEK